MFNIFLGVMYVFALICFVSLYFVPAGYGKMASGKWGYQFNNKIAWLIMECPTVIVSVVFIFLSLHGNLDKEQYVSRLILLSFFMVHYVYRSFIFPFLLRGKSKMPITIVLMGFLFNTINASLICWWMFYGSMTSFYGYSYFKSAFFIVGTLLFMLGFIANIDSDAYIRSLRCKGDDKHYFPNRHLYKYVCSANYFSEIVEWFGFALLTQSPAAFLFLIWTCANLVPRSSAIYKKYKSEFPKEMENKKVKRIFPFIY